MFRMSIKNRLAVGILGVLALSGCQPEKETVKSNAMQIVEVPLVINVLDEEAYNDCHIAGSIHSDFDKVESYVQNMSKDSEIILYCSNYACSTSDFVGKKLQSLGYTNVWAYEGGIAEWKQHGLPTVGPGKKEYLKRVMKKPAKDSDSSVPVISMDKLAEKLHVTRNVQFGKAA